MLRLPRRVSQNDGITLISIYRLLCRRSCVSIPDLFLNRSVPPVFKRQIWSIRGLPPNSTFASVVVSRVEIYSIEWITNQSEIDGINRSYTNVGDGLTIGVQHSGTLNISSNDNLLQSF